MRRGRPARPWFRDSDGWWYVTSGSKQLRLVRGKDNEGSAHLRWHELMSKSQITELSDDNLLKSIFDDYLTAVQLDIVPDNFRSKKFYLQRFLNSCEPALQVNQLKKPHIARWFAGHPNWASSTRWSAQAHVEAALNWAVKNDLITRNPLKGLKKSRLTSRGAASLVDPAEHARLLHGCPEYLQQIIIAVQQTACRPIEIFTLTAKNVDLVNRCLILEQHKTVHRTGKVKVIPLTEVAYSLFARLILHHPSGFLFRTATGKPWTSRALPSQIRRWTKKLKIQGKVSLYSYRHTFATNALERGVPDAQVAACLGHTNTAMLYKHYSHLTSKTQTLRNIFEQVNGAPSAPDPEKP